MGDCSGKNAEAIKPFDPLLGSASQMAVPLRYPTDERSNLPLDIRILENQEIDWQMLDCLPDRTLFQTRAWLSFVAKTQKSTPIIAEFLQCGRTVGFFSGLILEKWGFRILGSPLRGWSTDCMGFNLLPGVAPRAALRALDVFAFGKLRCVHLELLDRGLSIDDLKGLGYRFDHYHTFEIDLRLSEEALLQNMNASTRRYVRKLGREQSVIVEEAQSVGFAEEYYSQVKDVFSRKGLVPKYGVERVQELIDHLRPTGQLLLLRARDRQGKSLATGIFPATKDMMHFWGGASWRQAQKFHPNEAIQWHAMRYWKSRGVRCYDMGGGGAYKGKYGGKMVTRPWVRKSRNSAFAWCRNLLWRSFKLSLKVRGALKATA